MWYLTQGPWFVLSWVLSSLNEIMKLLASLAISANAAGVYVEKNEASEFLQRQGRANTGMLTEEFRTGKFAKPASRLNID